jgi:MoaA/NifB/PqqE/SkfB family radical SAM enzyme
MVCCQPILKAVFDERDNRTAVIYRLDTALFGLTSLLPALPATESSPMVPRPEERMATKKDFLVAWGRVLTGKAPLLSIELTRECPLHCPGCYAYGEDHLGGQVTLRQLRDLKGDELVRGVIALVKHQRPLQVSLVGGEPLVRKRELDRILPELSRMRVFTLVVTSAVAPIPAEWNRLPRVRIAVSIDGLRADHDARRQPATYDRILQNIAGRRVDISWVITRPQMRQPGYLDAYLSFWTAQPEVDRVWFSTYTPQIGEQSAEMLTQEDRRELARLLPELKRKYPALLLLPGMERSILSPPAAPAECMFSKMSVNYSADLKTRVEPCFFGGQPDCAQCGCAISTSLHQIGKTKLAGPVKINQVVKASIAVGALVNRLRPRAPEGIRWNHAPQPER